MRRVTSRWFSCRRTAAGTARPRRERRGAPGSPRATEPGCGAEPHVRRLRMKRSTLVAALVLLIFLPRTPAAADVPLLDALRAGDRTAVARLLQSGADPQVRDERGATALMYAT